MNTDPSFSFDLHPDLDAELDAAYERNNTGSTPEDIANKGLGAAVTQATYNADPLANANLPKAFAESLEDARSETRSLFGPQIATGFIQLPELNGPEFRDVDWGMLSKSYGVMDNRGLKPEIIFSPETVNFEVWEELYEQLPKTDLKVSNKIIKVWDEVIGHAESPWSVSVIPASDEPFVKNVDYDLYEAEDELIAKVEDFFTKLGINDVDMRYHYPSVAGYLTLQALLLKRGGRPIDRHSFTWLSNRVLGGTSAVVGHWSFNNFDLDRVAIDPLDPREKLVGVRPTIKGEEP